MLRLVFMGVLRVFHKYFEVLQGLFMSVSRKIFFCYNSILMFLFGYQFISNIQFSYYSTSDTFSTLDGLVCFPFVFEGFLKKSMLSSGKKSKIAFLVSMLCTFKS